MKKKSFIAFLLMFVVPFSARAQDTIEAAIKGIMQNSGNKLPMVFNKAIDSVAKIGDIFGNAAGVRIGGTTLSGVAALVIAKMIEDKVPSWVKWLLYIGGGTMMAGGGANITQLVTKFLS